MVLRLVAGGRVRFELPPAGRELAPVVMALGEWGARWMVTLGDEDLDPHLLMWDVRRNMALDALPEGRIVVGFQFTDLAHHHGSRWWLVAQDRSIDLCDFDPGYETTAVVISTLRTMVQVWRGDVSWAVAQRDHGLRIEGSASARRAVPLWLSLSTFAAVERAPSTAQVD